jgi:asparagine synthase (glutamine-hydrolysing)
MCGISGIWTSGLSPVEATRRTAAATRALAHRGPDDEGVEQVSQTGQESVRPLVVFGHRRLSILDLSAAGHQPMSDPAAGNWITYNGEIYNFMELRADLEKRGHRFVSHGDTEVILKAYAEWGVGCWRRLRGIFAFGLWDERYQELHLVRDHMGVKPLYFAHADHTLVFASEVRALLAAGTCERKLSDDGLRSYLKYGSVQEPGSLVKGVESLQPGHFLTCDAQGRKIQRHYWRLDECINRNWATQPSTDEVLAQLQNSVEGQLVSDVPLGVFLSGGMDSSAIAALAVRAGRGQVRTFCIGTDDKPSDESAEAASTAAFLGTSHTTLVLQGSSMAVNFGNALNCYDQPSIDGINTYFIAKLVREAGIKVALSGLGGDELFVGYNGFQKAMRVQQLGQVLTRLPRGLRLQLAAAIGRFGPLGGSVTTAATEIIESSPRELYFASRTLFSRCHIDRLLGQSAPAQLKSKNWKHREQRLVNAAESLTGVDRISFFELQTYMLSTLLRDADQMSMAHGLELRVPLIDPVLIENVMPILATRKFTRDQNKRLLMEAMAPMMPPVVAQRTKRGFSLPFQHWILRELFPVFEAHFNSGQLRGPWDRASYRSVWQEFQRGRVSWSRIMALYSLENWLKQNNVNA